ncbi:hypothetical protein [Streptomyces noursei]|uniref:hypothetical protein n=1 Tax=Streptomyces noursei TaxID=1971 RepID=UPI001F1A661D|nr:hypothetical protein [Streptomyces noursei]
MASPETGVLAARGRALAVLRVRGAALALALLPAAVAVVLLVGGATGRLGTEGGWAVARWAVGSLTVLSLLLATLVSVVVARARPALSPSVPVAEEAAPDLYRLVRDLADRLDVPAPSAIALTPDCDSWLEDRTHRAHGPPRPARRAGRRAPEAPVLVIGSPFLWWMRVAELRALLAPVVAGTGPSAHPDIAAARRFIRGLDAAAGVAARARGPLRALPLRFVGRVARLLLRAVGDHVVLMERGVAAAASERAQGVDYGLRIVAQEQVGLAYAGWDRLLTRVALPAWRMGRWPSRLDAGVVSALTELSRRDRLAQGFASRLGERPACDLLEEPGTIDRAASLLAARLFHGGPAEPGPNWSPVAWQQYPEEIVDRKWRLEAARLHRVLDELPAAGPADPDRTPADPPATTTAPPLTYAGARARTPAASHGEGLPRALDPAAPPPGSPSVRAARRRPHRPAPPVRASRRAPPRPPPPRRSPARRWPGSSTGWPATPAPATSSPPGSAPRSPGRSARRPPARPPAPGGTAPPTPAGATTRPTTASRSSPSSRPAPPANCSPTTSPPWSAAPPWTPPEPPPAWTGSTARPSSWTAPAAPTWAARSSAWSTTVTPNRSAAGCTGSGCVRRSRSGWREPRRAGCPPGRLNVPFQFVLRAKGT